jgi:hypothetical protein
VGQDAGAPSAATAAAPALPAPPASGEMGFVVVQFHAPGYAGPLTEDCPDGKGGVHKQGVLKDSYLRTLPEAEQARLNLAENANELDRKWKAYGQGANGTNICSHVYEFLDRPPTAMMQGKVAWGLNLDNDASGAGKDAYTCKHADFTSPTGEKGIDHQFWRVMGCSEGYRGVDNDGNGATRRYYDNAMMTGELTQVILLRGVNSLANDPDVEIVYANTDDRPIASASGQALANASFTVSLAGRKADYRNILHGRIINGVLTTNPGRVLLHNGVQAGMYSQIDLDRSRLRLTFQPDGSLKGMIGGYMPLLNDSIIARAGGNGSVTTAGIDCAGQYAAMRLMADGDKDPKTGQCRKISYAYEMSAVPAFVNDVEPARRIATK